MKGEGDGAGLMGAAVKSLPKQERGGIVASQLHQLHVLPRNQILDITRSGSYKINSISEYKGRIAARIGRGRANVLWIEWRKHKNVDSRLGSAGKKFKLRGKFTKTLLVRVMHKIDQETELIGILARGQSMETRVAGVRVRITHDKKEVGKFSVEYL